MEYHAEADKKQDTEAEKLEKMILESVKQHESGKPVDLPQSAGFPFIRKQSLESSSASIFLLSFSCAELLQEQALPDRTISATAAR